MLQNLKKHIYQLEAQTIKSNNSSNYLKPIFKFIRNNSNTFSQKKISNIYQKTKEFKYNPQIKIDIDKLNINNLETNNTCNLNCPMCDTLSSRRKKINMEVENFEKVIIEAKKINSKNNRIVSFHSVGEPMVSPQFEKYLAILEKHNFKLSLSTNGLLIERKIDILKKYSHIIDEIRFSIDGATKNTYELMRFPAKYEKLIHNLEVFTEVNKGNKYFKNVKMNTVICKSTLPELALHYEVYGKYFSINKIGFSVMNSLAPTDDFFKKDSVLGKHIILNNPCSSIVQNEHHIMANGDVSVCCRDYHGEIVVGNILKDRLKNIVNNDKSIELRKEQLKGINRKGLLCETCFVLDPKIDKLLNYYIKAIRINYIYNNMSISKIQKKFEQFFDLFENKYPSLDEYIDLFNFKKIPGLNY